MRPKFKGQISLPSPTAQVCFYLSYTQGKALVPALYRSFLSDSQLESFISCLLHPCGSEQKFKVTNGEQLPRGSCQFQTQLTALNFSSWFNFGLRRLDSLLVNSAIDLEIFLKTILFSIFSCFQWQGYLGYCRTIVSHLLLFIVCIFFFFLHLQSALQGESVVQCWSCPVFTWPSFPFWKLQQNSLT